MTYRGRLQAATRLDTRAVLLHATKLGNAPARCCGCGGFQWLRGKGAAGRRSQASWVVVANVYEGGRWDRIEYWHPECYEAAGAPHGSPTTKSPLARDGDGAGRAVRSRAGAAPDRAAPPQGGARKRPVALRRVLGVPGPDRAVVVEREIQAMTVCADALLSVDDDTRKRVLQWLRARLAS